MKNKKIISLVLIFLLGVVSGGVAYQRLQHSSAPDEPGYTCSSFQKLTKEIDNEFETELGISENIALRYSDEPIVKWRESNIQAYRGYDLEDVWEKYGKTQDLEKLLSRIDRNQDWVKNIGKNGIDVFAPMDIPMYRYPTGELARKIGLVVGDERYLLGVYQSDPEDLYQITGSSLQENEQAVVIRLFCAKPDKAIVDMYDKYFDLVSSIKGESTAILSEIGENLVRAELIYAGGGDYLAHQFFDTSDENWDLVETTGEFPRCDAFESAKIGLGASCFRAKDGVFDVVKY